MARDHRRLAAIVSLDVAEYSRLMGVDDSGTLAALKAHRREIIDPKIAEHDGRIVKTTGDGLLLEFPSVVDAVRCAVDVQRGMAERNAAIVPDQRLEFRIGINVGDIIIDGDDIFGDGVNVAARLEALADPGGICVSRVVRDQVLDKLTFTFEDLGAQHVKNIARAIEVYRIRNEPTGGAVAPSRPMPTRGTQLGRRSRGTGWRWWAAGLLVLGLAGIAAWFLPQFLQTASAPVPPALSVAILPFANPGGLPADEHFADALTEEVTTALGQWRAATVASGRKVSYKGKEIDTRAVGRELNVRYLVDGEIRRAGSKAAITVHLIDTESGTNAWSDRLEFDATRPTEMQSVLAWQLTRRLRAAIRSAEIKRAKTHPIAGSAADLVLLGDAVVADYTDQIDKLLAARKFYDDALRIDPNNVTALIRLAAFLDLLMTEDLVASPAVLAQRKAELDNVTAHAINIDARDAGAWAMRAQALAWLGRWDEALAAGAKAETLDPLDSSRVSVRASIALAAGRPDEALTLAERAVTMDQVHEMAGGFAHRMVCQSNFMLGRYGEALQSCEKAAARDNWWVDQAWLAAAYAQQGETAKAAVAKTELLRQKPEFTIDKLKASDAWANHIYLQLAESHLYAGLRKAGLPDR